MHDKSHERSRDIKKSIGDDANGVTSEPNVVQHLDLKDIVLQQQQQINLLIEK